MDSCWISPPCKLLCNHACFQKARMLWSSLTGVWDARNRGRKEDNSCYSHTYFMRIICLIPLLFLSQRQLIQFRFLDCGCAFLPRPPSNLQYSFSRGRFDIQIPPSLKPTHGLPFFFSSLFFLWEIFPLFLDRPRVPTHLGVGLCRDSQVCPPSNGKDFSFTHHIQRNFSRYLPNSDEETNAASLSGGSVHTTERRRGLCEVSLPPTSRFSPIPGHLLVQVEHSLPRPHKPFPVSKGARVFLVVENGPLRQEKAEP